MVDLEIELLFHLIDKYTDYEFDDGYRIMKLKRLIIEYAKSRNIDLDNVEIN